MSEVERAPGGRALPSSLAAPRPVAVPRAEYPRPQFYRPAWLSLNGTWQFEIDAGDSGLERGLVSRPLTSQITVPFAVESELSGIGEPDFMEAVWYRRRLQVPAEWSGRRVLLHIGACDYDTTVWVNDVEVGRHRGGFTSFTFDITSALGAVSDGPTGDTGVGDAGPRDGTAAGDTVVVRARDSRHGPKARGKQSRDYEGHGALYGRTTGIWQSVWLEAVPSVHLGRARITPDLGAGRFHLEVPVSANRGGHQVRAVLSDGDGEVVTATVAADLDLTARLVLDVPETRRRRWAPGDPHLYGLQLSLLDAEGTVVDEVESYAGLRSVAIDGLRVLINGAPVFQRLVLDQGFYPDGIMTAPSDQALVADIEMSMAAGFNGARLHQKVFEERFLYHADRLGYLVWGEFGDWGCNQGTELDNQQPDASYVSQWLEAIERDYSHPAIVGWCPLNETAQRLTGRITTLDDVTRAMYLATKALDTSRPVLDTSGYSHRVTEADIYDSHNYEQDPETFAAEMAGSNGRPYTNVESGSGHPISVAYRGQPYFCSEFGGIRWDPDEAASERSWGYGQAPQTEEEFYDRFDRLVGILLDDPTMFGYCYTQLTDVYQEHNGIYRFDRSHKVDIERIRRSQVRRAAIEMARPAAIE
jgi:beta-galactosidase/beta-glucuronidase